MSADDGSEPAVRASDADREHVAGLLGEALADGRLTVDEHKERIDRVYATKTRGELVPLTADLGTEGGVVERRRQADAVPVEQVAPQVAILSSSEVKPTGRVEGRLVAVGVLGNARIDLSYATLGEDGVQVSAQAILAAVDIVVPADARVRMSGVPLLGSLSPTREPGPADGPTVDVRAVAALGSVTIHRAEPKELDQ